MWRAAWILFMTGLVVASAGCRNPSSGPGGGLFARNQPPQPPATVDPQLAQLQELHQRALDLDKANRQLQAQVASSELLRDENDLLRRQLGDTAKQLKAAQTAKTDADRQLQTHVASIRNSGGATIRANNSLTKSLQVVDIPGYDVQADGDVVRIRLPSDRLFVQGTAQLQTNAVAVLDQVANAVRQNYPDQIIGVEGHTDSTPASGVVMSNHQLAASQALAVFTHLSRTGRLAKNQMFVMSSGENQPLFSNGNPDGRAKNRRVELVIYPESTKQ